MGKENFGDWEVNIKIYIQEAWRESIEWAEFIEEYVQWRVL
jgi:hypothetical protein